MNTLNSQKDKGQNAIGKVSSVIIAKLLRSDRVLASARQYDCERCLCTKYKPKGIAITDCAVCGHPKHWHYSQK